MSWAVLSSFITTSIAIPATIQNNISTRPQPNLGFPIPASVLDHQTYTPPSPHPPAPYDYRLRRDQDFLIRFKSYGAGIAKQDGNVLLYRAIHAVQHEIRTIPAHAAALWDPDNLFSVVDKDVSLTLRAPSPDVIFGDVWLCLDGLAQFMRDHGFVECHFDFFMVFSEFTPPSTLAWGILKRIELTPFNPSHMPM
ncbi:MAG: hypothetical protein Q9226_009098 [Calogaya cf. arnoldii]